jgi:predicted P-loop ATPase
MPVFIGSQNCGKSSFFSYITPPDYTDDEMYPWATTVQQSIEYLKDRPHALHQGWIVLMDEFERYSKRKYCEELKNLVSVSVDNSARKYENERRFPRSFVLAGATNSRDFLVDPTGNRRFMPILVNGVVAARENPDLRIIDLDRLKLDRDSIWSAAYKAFLDGEPHVFSSYEISCIDETINSFTRDTPVYGAVVEALNRGLRRSDSTSLLRTTRGKRARQCIVLNSLFEEMHVPVDRHSNMNIPVTDVLKQLGFKDDRGILENDSSGRQVRVWILPRNFMKRRLTDDMPFS